MNNWNIALDRWIFDSWPVTGKQLSVFRLLYAGWMLFILGTSDFTEQVRNFPDGGFNPVPGIGRLFSQMPPIWFFDWSEWIVVIGYACLFLGLATRFWSVVLPLLIMVGKSCVFASGKIDGSILPIIIPLVLVGSDWGAFYAIRPTYPQKRHNQWPLTFMSLLLGFGLFTAGVLKLLGGWLDPGQSMVRAYFLRNYFTFDRHGAWSTFFLDFTWSPFWEFQDWMTLFFELGIFPAILWPKIFRGFTVLAMVFHVAVLLLLRISFVEFIIVYWLFWIPLARVECWDEWWRRSLIPHWVMGILVALALFMQLQNGHSALFMQMASALGLSYNTYALVVLGIPTLMMIGWYAKQVGQWCRTRRTGK